MSPSSIVHRAILLIVFSLIVSVADAKVGISPAVNPSIHYSRNNLYSLQVIPSDRRGTGKAEYVFAKQDKELWRKQLPYTLLNMDISNKGEIAGYAHSLDKNNKAELQLLLLDSSGKPRYHKRFTREFDNRLHGSYWPYASRVAIHDYNRIATFIVHHLDQDPQRLALALDEGKKLADEPLSYRTYDIDSILPSPYNEFSLSFDKKQHRDGDKWFYDTEFCLLGSEWEKLFCRQYPNDVAQGDKTALEILETAESTGALMGFTAAQQFWFASIKNRQQELFTLHNGLLDMLGLADAPEPQLALVRPLPPRPAKLQTNADTQALPSLRLLENRPLPALQKAKVGDIQLAALDDLGNKAVISRLDKNYRFEIYDADNRLLSSQPLPVDFGKLMPADLVYYRDGQWLFLLDYFDDPSRLLLLSGTGELLKEISLAVPGISDIAPDQQGNIVFIARGQVSPSGYLHDDILGLMDSKGNVLWKIQEHASKPGGLLSPEDVAISPDQQILVLDNITDKLKSYDMRGHFLRELDLEEKQGMNSSYLTKMAVAKDGIVRVFDSSTGQIFIVSQWMLQDKFQPQEANGRSIGHVWDMDVDSQNRLWITSDGVLRRMNVNGKEAAALPAHPALPDFEAVSWMSVNAKGEMFLYDEHHFILSKVDAKGNMKEIFRVPPEEQGGLSGFFNAGISKTNTGFVVHGKGNRYFEIDETGKPAKEPVFECQDICRDVKIKRECNTACPSVVPQLGAQRFWQKGFYALDLLDGIYPRKIYAHIEKASDNTWLDIHDIYFSENGWVVVQHGEVGPTQTKIAVFDERGTPRATFTHKGYAGKMQVAGDLVYIMDYASQQIVVYDLEGKQLSVTSLISDDRLNWPIIYASPANKKLYLVSNGSIKIYELLHSQKDQP